jgi:hypothetical protein
MMMRWHTVLCVWVARFRVLHRTAISNLAAFPLARLLKLLLLLSAAKDTKLRSLLLIINCAVADAAVICPARAAQSRCECPGTSCSSCSSRQACRLSSSGSCCWCWRRNPV